MQLLKSELRNLLDEALMDHLEGTDAEESVPDVSDDILGRMVEFFDVVNDEEPDEED